MWATVLTAIFVQRHSIRMLHKSLYKLKFLLILLATVFLWLGWNSWLLTIPYPLPQGSVTALNKSNLIPGSYYESTVLPTGQANYLSAAYRVWIPDNVQTLRGLIVRQHGCGDPAATTGLDHANDLQWQALAYKHQFALLGAKLSSGERICDYWAVIDRGSEKAFLSSLTALAKQSHHPELKELPWVLWGHSGGADWGMQMMQKYPNRTIAVVAMRCGGVRISGASQFLLSAPDPAIFEVPVLLAEGEKETAKFSDECLNLPKQIFYRYRQAGAVWALAVESDTGHEANDTRLLAIPYLDAILTKRLKLTDTVLHPLDPSQGWLGSATTHAIAPIRQYKEDPLEAAWLPDEETARKWQQYFKKNTWNQLKYKLCKAERLFILKIVQYPMGNCHPNKILPTRKPAAPTNVRVNKNGKAEVVLTWNFFPDLENGLPSFRIYRDNRLIKTFQGQEHNFGDAPEQLHVVLEFHDKDVKPHAIYTVSAFNALGESVSQPSQSAGEIQNRLSNVNTLPIEAL